MIIYKCLIVLVLRLLASTRGADDSAATALNSTGLEKTGRALDDASVICQADNIQTTCKICSSIRQDSNQESDKKLAKCCQLRETRNICRTSSRRRRGTVASFRNKNAQTTKENQMKRFESVKKRYPIHQSSYKEQQPKTGETIDTRGQLQSPTSELVRQEFYRTRDPSEREEMETVWNNIPDDAVLLRYQRTGHRASSRPLRDRDVMKTTRREFQNRLPDDDSDTIDENYLANMAAKRQQGDPVPNQNENPPANRWAKYFLG